MASFYFSTSLSTVLSVAVLLLWFSLGYYSQLLVSLRQNPCAAWAFGLYLLVIVGSFYGTASYADALSMLGKYREFLLVVVLVPFFNDSHYRRRTWQALVLASVVTLLISYAMHIGLLDDNRQGDPCLKSRITHSMLIAFFMFYCAHQAYSEQNKPERFWWLLLVLLSVYNIFFIVEGRTGQLIAVVLGIVFALQCFHRRQLLLALLVIIGFVGLFMLFSDKAARIYEGLANTQAYFQVHPEQTHSSMGLRYTFWQQSLHLIQEQPFLGHGTGSFSQAYQHVNADAEAVTKNPHNEFLMIAVQWGWLGLLMYLGFLFCQPLSALSLQKTERFYAQGLWVSLLIYSFFNSPFLDHSGHWFALMIALIYARNKQQPDAINA